MPLTLSRGNWYGLIMFPGYFDQPYHSPIRVDEIEPLGQRQFCMKFFNVGYTAGVQSFEKRLRTLQRSERHLVAQETQPGGRTYVIMDLNEAWLGAYFPHLSTDTYFKPNGQPDSNALTELAANACDIGSINQVECRLM